MRAPLEFTVLDNQGKPHNYVVSLFPAEEGIRLLGEVMGIVSGPLATVAGAAAGAISEGGKLSDVLERELGSLDTEAIANQLRTTFMSGAPSKLMLRLVTGATRDNQPLRSSSALDDAYAGNYVELVRAAWKIAEGNGLSPLAFIDFGQGSAATKSSTPASGA